MKEDMLTNNVVINAAPFLPKNLPKNPLNKDPINDKNITNKYILFLEYLIMFFFHKNKTKKSII